MSYFIHLLYAYIANVFRYIMICPRDYLSQRPDSSEMNPLGPTSLVVARRTTRDRAGDDSEFRFYVFTTTGVLSW
jgi:hypothetical protein